ncbi:MAG: PAS domain S-box protein [Caldilineaceae bacterium]
MIAHLQRFFTAPRLKDPVAMRTAVLLNLSLWTLTATGFVYLIVTAFIPFEQPWRLLLIPAIGLWIGLRGLMHRGRVRTASLILVSSSWLLTTLFALATGGVASHYFPSYILWICLAGWLLGEGWALGLAGLSAGAGLGLLWVARLNHWLEEAPMPTPLSLWLTATVIFGLVALFFYFTKQSHQPAQMDLSDVFAQAILDSLTSHIAVLDQQGVIVAVNQAWMQFAQKNGGAAASNVGVGANYLAVCQQALAKGDAETGAEAQAMLNGLQAILNGAHTPFTLEYACHSPTEKRWFIAAIAPLVTKQGGAVVVHGNITERKQIEAALRQSEARYRQLVEVSPYPIFINRQNRVVYANPACLRLFGADAPEQLIGKAVFDLVHPDYHAEVRQRIATYLSQGRSTPQVEQQYVRLDGATVDVEVTSAPIYDEKELAYLVIARNITGRKRADAALRQSEARNRALVEAIPDAMVRVHRHGRYLDFSAPKDYPLFRPLDQMSGLQVQDLFPTALADQIMHYCHQALTLQKLQTFEFTVPIGEEMHFREARVVPAGLDEVIAIIRDVTEPKRAEAALQESERRFRAFFELAAVGAAEVEAPSGRYLAVNAKYCEITGYSKAELLTMTTDEITDPADRALDKQARLAFAQGAEGEYLAEKRYIRKDGQLIWCKIAARTVHDGGERPAYTVSIAEDITARKQAEARIAHLLHEVDQHRTQLQALNRRLAETQENERKGLARELHDRVGQNLTALGINLSIVQAQLAQQAANSQPIQARMNDALALVTEMSEQIRDVLADLRPPMLDNFGLLATLQWYARLVAKRTGLPIVVQGEEPSPRLAEQSELTLFRVTQEALTNVLKHAQATEAMLRLTFDKEQVRLQISDNGRGMASPTFLPAPQTPTGWGILTMQERVAAIGGRLQISSQPDQGTTVVVEVNR